MRFFVCWPAQCSFSACPVFSEGVATPLASLAPELGASRWRPALGRKQIATSRRCRNDLVAYVQKSEDYYKQAISTLPKPENPVRKDGGEAANFWRPHFESWRGGTRLLIFFLKVFACRPLVLSDDNMFVTLLVLMFTSRRRRLKRS